MRSQKVVLSSHGTYQTPCPSGMLKAWRRPSAEGGLRKVRKRPWLLGLCALLLLAVSGCGRPAAAKPHGVLPSARKTTPGGSWELAIVRQGNLYLVTKPGGPEIRLTRGLSASHPLFSPDGRYIAFMSGSATAPSPQYRLGIVGTNGKGLELLKPGTGVLPGDYAWSPTQDTLAVWGQGLALLHPGGSPTIAAGTKGIIGTFAWAPGGQGYAYTVMPPAKDFPGASDTLWAVSSGKTPHLLATAPTASGLELQGYWPSGQGLLYWIDPLHSASLAADGLGLESLPLGGGAQRSLATTLPYPSWVQPDGRESILLVAGPGRQTWTEKALERCDPVSGTCSVLQTGAGQVALDPAGTSSGWIAWVGAKDLGRSAWSEVSSLASLDRWERTRALYVGFDGKGASQATLVAKGSVFDPEFSPDGQSLLYVQAGAIRLWRSGHGSLLLAKLPAAAVLDYYGYRDYGQVFAWYPGAPRQP